MLRMVLGPGMEVTGRLCTLLGSAAVGLGWHSPLSSPGSCFHWLVLEMKAHVARRKKSDPISYFTAGTSCARQDRVVLPFAVLP